MSLQLRDKLRLSASCGEKELREACNRYYSIYKAVEESATDPYVKKMAGLKLADLVASAAEEGISLDGAQEFSAEAVTQTATWDVEGFFSSVITQDGIMRDSQVSRCREMLSKLPESPKKHYLEFILESNRQIINEENIVDLQRMITEAIKGDPENPVYRQLSEDLVGAMKEYNRAYSEWYENRQHIEIVDYRKKLIKRILKFIGSGSFRLLSLCFGALLAFIGCMMECICNDC